MSELPLGILASSGAGEQQVVSLNDFSYNVPDNFIGFNSIVFDCALQADGKLIAIGLFTSYRGIDCPRIARINPDNSLDTSFNFGAGFSSSTSAIALQPDGKILVGGLFTAYNNVVQNRIARLNVDGSLDTSFNIGTGFNGQVAYLELQSDGKILVGGVFTSYNGILQNRLVRLNTDGSLDTSFNIGTGFNSTVDGIRIQPDGKVIVGGAFTAYNNVVQNRIARLNVDGSLDTSFNIGTGFNSTVVGRSIKIQSDGKILVGGGFTSYNGILQNRLVRLNTDGSLDTSFNIGTGFNSTVLAIALQPDGKILVGGGFTSYNGSGGRGNARLNTDGSIDTTFPVGDLTNRGNLSINGQGRSVIVRPNGNIIFLGDFTAYTRSGELFGVDSIVELNSNGNILNTFLNSLLSGGVLGIAIQPDGKAVLIGTFTGSTRQTIGARITRLDTDGLIDATFNTGIGFNVAPNSVSIAPDGSIWAAMSDPFRYNNISGRYLARISPTGQLIPVSVTHPTEEIPTNETAVVNKYTTDVRALPTGNIVYSMSFQIEEEDD